MAPRSNNPHDHALEILEVVNLIEDKLEQLNGGAVSVQDVTALLITFTIRVCAVRNESFAAHIARIQPTVERGLALVSRTHLTHAETTTIHGTGVHTGAPRKTN